MERKPAVEWTMKGRNATKRWQILLLLAASSVVAFGACRGGPQDEPGRVSDDPLVQATYETALQTVEEIRSSARKGEDVVPACRTAGVVIVAELEPLDRPEVRAVLRDLAELCPHQGPAPAAAAADPATPGGPAAPAAGPRP